MRITHLGELFAEVHWNATPKPFLYPVHAPGGTPLTRAFPMGDVEDESHDHPHHQSLWFAHGDVNGFDFWHGAEHRERIVAVGTPALEAGEEGARLTCHYEWRVDDGEVIAHETRVLDFSWSQQAHQLDVSVELSPSARPLVFGDTKEGTFAVRLHAELRVEGEVAAGHLTSSQGLEDGEVWGERARWVDAHGTVDGEQVGLTVFDHPNNPRHPTWWHARKYGLLAANPFGAHDFEGVAPGTGDLEVALGETLELRYRVLAHAGEWDAGRLEAAYRDWVAR